MIYEFQDTDQIFAVAPDCKYWRWQIDGTRVLAYLEPHEGVDASGWTIAENVADSTVAWLEKK
jgi:hypothetical protein